MGLDIGAGIVLGMTNTSSCRHSLRESGTDDAVIAECVGVFDFTRKNPRDDLHIGMTVRAETRCRRDSVVIAHKQQSVTSVRMINIRTETETVFRVEPPDLRFASGTCFSDLDGHGDLSPSETINKKPKTSRQ